MKYKTLKSLKDEDLKPYTGVQRNIFELMLAVAEAGLRNFGRPTLLSQADQLLLTLLHT